MKYRNHKYEVMSQAELSSKISVMILTAVVEVRILCVC
jgi:hypothetical protein